MRAMAIDALRSDTPSTDTVSRWGAVASLCTVLDLGLLLTATWWPVLNSQWLVALHLLTLAAMVALLFVLLRDRQQLLVARRQLRDGIDAMEEGLVLYDDQDRLVTFNPAFARQYDHHARIWRAGMSYEDMLRASVATGMIVEAVGREEAWIRRRMDMHRHPGEPWLQELAGERWMRVHEHRTATGAYISLRTDVTELMRIQHELTKAREQAQRDRQLLERAVDAMPAGIEIYDEQDRLLMANRRMIAWQPHLNYESARGETFETLAYRTMAAGALPSDALGREEEWLAARLARRGRRDEPMLSELSEGLWIKTYETRTPEGYLVAVRQDVTDLIAAQSQLQAIIGTAGVAILTMSLDGQILSANPAAERLLGYTQAHLQEDGIGMLAEPQERGALLSFLLEDTSDALHAHGSLIREFHLVHHGGRELIVQFSASQVRGGQQRLVVAVLLDLTERQQFENELQLANAQLRRLSTTDALTELANRRLLMQRLEQEWHRSQRALSALSLMVIDVDHFKLFNDHYGHQAGDACLRRVASALRDSVNRNTDLVARYGGEEFVLLLPQTEIEGAKAVAQRCHEVLEAAAIEHALSPLSEHVTISIGVVSGQPPRGSSASQWLTRADLALYQAKAQGRNRSVVAD